MDYKVFMNEWLTSNVIDSKSKDEILRIRDESELIDRFYQELEFGTAGLRGKLGAGTNRMNRYTVGKATEGLARTIESRGDEAKKRGVAISYDVRHGSKDFAYLAAGILANHGIMVHIFSDIRPTPMLSFAVRELNTISGIMVTASHNPKEYNGYKVYWDKGSQILDDIADEIVGHIKEIKYEDIAFPDNLNEKTSLIHQIKPELDERYYSLVINSAIRDEALAKDIKVVFTPLNGTGNLPVRHVLAQRGFNHVKVVPEQELPDGDFKTVGYPNPEDPKAFDVALQFAKEIRAELIIATDPDCDRVSMMCLNKSGNYVGFNGNQIGALLVHYILSGLKELNKIPNDAAMVKSLVTGDLGKAIAANYNIPMFDTLTGFKHICNMANKWDESKEYQFLFGYEESIGYVYKDFVRDKDAVISSMLLVEMADYYLSKDQTLDEVLENLYDTYGFHMEKLISIVLEGAEGQEKIGKMMDGYIPLWK